MSRIFEESTSKSPESPGIAFAAALVCLQVVSYFQDRKIRAEVLSRAEDYTKRAAEPTASEAETGLILLAAGRSYLNARKPRKALASLEVAQPLLENHKLQHGTFASFSALASLYQSLSTSYQDVGRAKDYESTQAQAEHLAVEFEEYFGLHTDFLPDGSRAVYSIASRVVEPLASVFATEQLI